MGRYTLLSRCPDGSSVHTRAQTHRAVSLITPQGFEKQVLQLLPREKWFKGAPASSRFLSF